MFLDEAGGVISRGFEGTVFGRRCGVCGVGRVCCGGVKRFDVSEWFAPAA